MKPVRNFSIKWKLVIILLTVSFVTLIVSSGILVINDLKVFKERMVRNLTVLAGAVGANSRAAIFFDDPETGADILASLRKEPQIQYAALYNSKNDIFVTYSRNNSESFKAPTIKEEGHVFVNNSIELVRPIILKGKIIGKIYLNANLQEFQDLIKEYIFLCAMILITALGISLVLSLKLQKIISEPILRLADITKEVSQKSDYTVRAKLDNKDELGILYSGFNEMLAQIQKRDQELDRYSIRLEDLVKERTQELENAQKELVVRERLAVMGKLAAMVSHEIRNPLGAIRNTTFSIEQIIREKHPELVPSLELIERNILRCDNIIAELLEFSRTQEEKMEIIDLDPWLSSLLGEQTIPPPIILEKKFLSGAKAKLVCERFRRAVINILQNGIQTMLEKYEGLTTSEKENYSFTLKVETLTNGNNLEIYFIDSGMGIEKDQIRQIFEPLYSTKSYGVGLGLSIVEGIMKQHHGGIELKSEVGQGTRVKLWLPWVKEQETP